MLRAAEMALLLTTMASRSVRLTSTPLPLATTASPNSASRLEDGLAEELVDAGMSGVALKAAKGNAAPSRTINLLNFFI